MIQRYEFFQLRSFLHVFDFVLWSISVWKFYNIFSILSYRGMVVLWSTRVLKFDNCFSFAPPVWKKFHSIPMKFCFYIHSMLIQVDSRNDSDTTVMHAKQLMLALQFISFCFWLNTSMYLITYFNNGEQSFYRSR